MRIRSHNPAAIKKQGILTLAYLSKASGTNSLLAHVALLSPGEDAELGAHAEEADLSPPHVLLHLPVQR